MSCANAAQAAVRWEMSLISGLGFFGFEVTCNVETLANDESQRKGITPEFEINPDLGAVVGRHIGVNERHKSAIRDPDQVEPHPYWIGQLQLATEQQFKKVFLPH